MTNKTNSKRIIIATVLCVAYLLLTIFYYHIDKQLTGVIFAILTLLVPILLIAIIVFTIRGLMQIYQHRQSLTLNIAIPTIVCVLTLLYFFYSPYRLDSENLESPIELRACYEGIQNQATLKFREDKTFELHWTGAFFANSWWTGKWLKNGDTITFNYDKEIVKPLGEKVLIDNGYLRPIGNSVDTLKFFRRMFYLGYCRHEN